MARHLSPDRRRPCRPPLATVLRASIFLCFAAGPVAVGAATWRASVAGPSVGLEDIYKALHQAWRGPGHMIPSRQMAADYLDREWQGLGRARPQEALVETLETAAPFLRLNLRPYRDAGGSVDSLLEAFLRSAAAPTDSAAFVRDWQGVGKACGRRELPFSRAAFDSLDDLVRLAGYPAIHHSAAFAARYLPAYRVLTLPEARRLVENLARRPE